MTEVPAPEQNEQPPMRAPKSRMPRWRALPWTWIAALVITAAASYGAGYATHGGSSTAVAQPAGAPQVAPADSADSGSPPDDTGYTPTPDDFTIGIKVLSKQCFGSAGCNIEFRIDPSYTGATLRD